MRLLATIITALMAHGAFAAQIVIQSPCSEEPWLVADIEGRERNVGALTIEALESNGIQFVGSESGINSIRDTVTGQAALQIISDSEMHAYGWCFRVNDVEPNTFPHKIVARDGDVIHWIFGFAHYKDGTWISNCTPTHIAKPEYICGTR